MKRLFITVGALALVSTAAFGAPADKPGHKVPAPGTNSETVSAVEDATAGAIGVISAEMASTTKGFATAAAISDMYEVAAAKIMLDRSGQADVKAFAQKMVDAHTATTAKLKGLLPAGITPPAHVDSRRQGMLDNLNGASGADLDHRYAVQQVAAHKEADILMRGYAKDGDNAGIKEFARNTDKDVKMHLSAAQKLEKKYK